MSTPAIFKNLSGKVDPEVGQVIELLGKGLKDAHDAIAALKGQHDTLASQVQTVSDTATAASQTANNVAAAQQQPVSAGQVTTQTADYTTQQSDQLGVVLLQGTTALTITLNNNVTLPFSTRIANQTTQVATLQPSDPTAVIKSAASPSGSPTYSLPSGSTVTANFLGLDWVVS